MLVFRCTAGDLLLVVFFLLSSSAPHGAGDEVVSTTTAFGFDWYIPKRRAKLLQRRDYGFRNHITLVATLRQIVSLVIRVEQFFVFDVSRQF